MLDVVGWRQVPRRDRLRVRIEWLQTGQTLHVFCFYSSQPRYHFYIPQVHLLSIFCSCTHMLKAILGVSASVSTDLTHKSPKLGISTTIKTKTDAYRIIYYL